MLVLSQKLRAVARFARRPYIALPLAALFSVGASVLFELLGLRLRLGIGGEEYSYLAGAIGAIFIFCAAAVLIYARDTEYDPRDRRQALLIALVILACLLICASEIKNIGELREYPFEGLALHGTDIYSKQFDAFMKGQVHLDLPVSESLLKLENPYDFHARRGIYYFWDHALFDGQYYSYFGLAPILTVYFPCYFLTGALPPLMLVCTLFAMAATVFVSLALRELVIFLGARPKLWLFLLAIPSVAFGCGVFASQSYSDIYYTAVLSALCFNSLFFFLALRACRAKRAATTASLFGASALAFVLAVMSRPTAALICLALTPVIFKKMFLGHESRATRISSIASFATVVGAGAAFVMWFNYARFGSPLDFGANYQLTINDVSTNTVTLTVLPATIFHYFLQFPFPKNVFPYYGPSYIGLDYGERFVYFDKTIGALFFPSTLGLVLAPIAYGVRERIRNFRTKDHTRALVCALGALITLVIAFADFCKAGVNMRYLFDILPLAVLLGSAILLRFAGDAKGDSSRTRSILAAVCFVLTLISGLSIVLENAYDVLFLTTEMHPR